jgi:hypothetical protein
VLRRLVEDGDEEAEDDEEVEEEKDMQKTCERTLEEGEKARRWERNKRRTTIKRRFTGSTCYATRF